MRKCYTCENCGEDITIGLLRGFAHITCKHCQTTYQLDQRSMKIYMFFPFLAVAIAVGLSITFLEGATIDVKTIFILGLSFTIVYTISNIFVRMKILTYEKKIQ